jgi:hypothetical protein
LQNGYSIKVVKAKIINAMHSKVQITQAQDESVEVTRSPQHKHVSENIYNNHEDGIQKYSNNKQYANAYIIEAAKKQKHDQAVA